MESSYKATCPLDCFDLCLMDVTVVDGEIQKIAGAKEHPLTCGVLCKKGMDHLVRHRDQDRLKTPLLRQGERWLPLTVEEGVKMLAEKLGGVDTKSILYFTDSGHNGLSKTAASLFFQHLGPITTHRGSLCWDAGNFALKKSLGIHAGVRHTQIPDADAIVLWGRNAKDTNLHLYMQIKKAGKPMIYIDPIVTATAKEAEEYYCIKPNSDLELALAVVKILSQQGNLYLAPKDEAMVASYSMDMLVEKTGLSVTQLERLSTHFAGDKRIITYIGYGLQRYTNGAKAVEAIIALHYLTGNVNKPGTGFHFSDKRVSKSLAKPYDVVRENLTFVKSTFGTYVSSRDDWSVLLVDKSNPVVQLPNTKAVQEAIKKIPFKVGIDLFMTDTMKEMDLVFPAPSVFECQDVVITSMFSPYLQFTEECVPPPPEVVSEYDLFQRLAGALGLDDFPKVGLEEFLFQHVKPVLEAQGVTWEDLKTTGWMDPESEKEKNRKLQWLEGSLDVFAMIETKTENPGSKGKYRLITPHAKESLHSQGFRTVTELPLVYMNEPGFESGDMVVVASDQGRLRCKVKLDENLQSGLVYIYEGYWSHSGIVNSITTDAYSDEGDQAAYYETLVSVMKIKE
ncbi:molybdopterin-dependent oxidoreductase [Alkalibacter rhizosphaerae]|uniref:Molybdopterin-dependent oxidoreductase n=1 Tax=Alkalibacter rhizosphaerae TaxID=2815577 RepID=A0A974XG21_9FIRM|nr:molybdopterin-dependent oxidoreductase [Alkalibacter rhizosphaerae]QSX09148.1 molybdopterin-dependent oxidoreductase [Alkalibacter rhizosphaerae]